MDVVGDLDSRNYGGGDRHFRERISALLATKTIPIVFIISTDPAKLGWSRASIDLAVTPRVWRSFIANCSGRSAP